MRKNEEMFLSCPPEVESLATPLRISMIIRGLLVHIFALATSKRGDGIYFDFNRWDCLVKCHQLKQTCHVKLMMMTIMMMMMMIILTLTILTIIIIVALVMIMI